MIGELKNGDFEELCEQYNIVIQSEKNMGNSLRSLYLFVDGTHQIILNSAFDHGELWEVTHELVSEIIEESNEACMAL